MRRLFAAFWIFAISLCLQGDDPGWDNVYALVFDDTNLFGNDWRTPVPAGTLWNEGMAQPASPFPD